MLDEEIEVIDSENNEDEIEEDEVETEDVSTLKAKNQSLYEQLKKAKGFERGDDGKWTKKAPKESLNQNQTQKQSDGFGYDVKAYLKSSGITADEFDFVKAEMKASGKDDIDALLDSKYFQEALETHRELKKTSNATIKGKRSGGVAVDSVEYWAGKDFADVPVDMRGKVLAHREAKEKNKGQFYNQ